MKPMYINVGPGVRCWLVILVDPNRDIYYSGVLLRSFPEKQEALDYAYRLTKLQVCVDNSSTERR